MREELSFQSESFKSGTTTAASIGPTPTSMPIAKVTNVLLS
jgi:hypothetical protein